MNTSELRKGNYVYVNNHKHCKELQNIPMKVKGIGNSVASIGLPTDTITVEKIKIGKYDMYLEYCQFPNFIEPIKILEEWLFKFGFKRSYIDNWSIEYVLGSVNIQYSKFAYIFYFRYEKQELGHKNFFSKNFTYVHELQNLVYVLTDQELVFSA